MNTVPTRREPPPFRRLRVARVAPRSSTLVGLTLTGDELRDFEPGLPAASVRLLVPPADGSELVLPTWNGNEFLFADGTRPPIRTLTPLRFDRSSAQLDVEVVRHGSGVLSDWVDSVRPGDPTALSGPGRGYEVDPSAESYLLVGDESALPAITTLLPELPADARVTVIVEVTDPAARIELPEHPGATIQWLQQAPDSIAGDAMVDAVRSSTLHPEVRVWAAGEAARVQQIRRHLFQDVGVPRAHAVVRGYWKYGREGAGSA